MVAHEPSRASRVLGTRPGLATGEDEQSAATGRLEGVATDNPLDEKVSKILSAHIASTLLTCFILDCSISIGLERRRARPDKGTIVKLTGMRREARHLQRVLDPGDVTLVETILKRLRRQYPFRRFGRGLLTPNTDSPRRP
jgi:hypothetical protein